ncbi:unnamed protein product, partial [Durusdinium trenchii]
MPMTHSSTETAAVTKNRRALEDRILGRGCSESCAQKLIWLEQVQEFAWMQKQFLFEMSLKRQHL